MSAYLIVFKNELTEVIRFKNLPYEKVGSVLQKFSDAGFGFKRACCEIG